MDPNITLMVSEKKLRQTQLVQLKPIIELYLISNENSKKIQLYCIIGLYKLVINFLKK